MKAIVFYVNADGAGFSSLNNHIAGAAALELGCGLQVHAVGAAGGCVDARGLRSFVLAFSAEGGLFCFVGWVA